MKARAAALLSVGALGAEQPSFLFLLADDIGWGDFGYNNGTALTPNIDAWGRRPGSLVMQDGHSGGTVCSPTRATILTGRNHFRDCVDYVYDCSDMTECEPSMPFAQQRTFTFPDAARKADKGYESFFGGKWHLGSLFNDSEVPSGPLFHGFDKMNATVEVVPTATANCGCNAQWEETCNFGHYQQHNHCAGGPGPAGSAVPDGCCFNYWWEDPSSPHGVTNLTNPSYDDDSQYVAEAFEIFLDSRKGQPFAAQLSFHNCHIPFIGTAAARKNCQEGKTCKETNRHGDSAGNFTDYELDYYACLSELDASVGRVLKALEDRDYYDNTFIWFTTDNGPEVNCRPDGFCPDDHYKKAPGDAGPLRGRKRDIWEGGHRVPTVVSWPAMQRGSGRQSWDTVVTMDFFATVLEVLQVERPERQANWGFDGKSILPILKGEAWPERGIGWIYHDFSQDSPYGFRYGKWKYVHNSTSCQQPDCMKDQLFDLEADLSETTDLSAEYPEVLQALKANFSLWFDSLHTSRKEESLCEGLAEQVPSDSCEWHQDVGLEGEAIETVVVRSKEECCGICNASPECGAAEFNGAMARHSRTPRHTGVYAQTMEDDLNPAVGFDCHLKKAFTPKEQVGGSIACLPQRVALAV